MLLTLSRKVPFFNKSPILIFILTALVLYSGCQDNQDCVTENISQITVRFFLLQNDNKPQPVRVGFKSVYTKNVDSLFYSAGDTVSTMVLPAHPFQDKVTYYFESNNFLDSLTLNYDRQPRLISPICGTEQVYKNLSIGATSFDSVAVTNKKLTFNADNISIFF